MVRGLFTLAGAAGAGLLIWISTQIGEGTREGYWAVYGLVAGAGLAAALSQLFGGWTKWGWPRISGGVFVLGFLPLFVVVGWVLLAGQPEANWFQRHADDWSDALGVGGVVDDLRGYLGVLAFALGLALGFTFDTKGPLPPPIRLHRRGPPAREPEEHALEEFPTPEPVIEPPAGEPEPVTLGSGIDAEPGRGDT